jgi:hypothetical protein
VRFLKQIFGYTALHYIVDRPHLQLSTCMVCLAFQQLEVPASLPTNHIYRVWNMLSTGKVLKSKVFTTQFLSNFKKTLNHLKIKDMT